MNSWALHLIAILVLGSLHMFPNKQDFVLVTAAASISVSAENKEITLSSTLRPYLLPQHHSISTSASTKSNIASSKATKTMTSKLLAHADPKSYIQIPAETASFTLEHTAELGLANGARQNHSLQSRSRGDRSEAAVSDTNAKISQQFSKDRRYHFRNIHHAVNTNPMSATTAAPNEEPLTASAPTTSRRLMPTLSMNRSTLANHVQQPENFTTRQRAQKTPRMIHRLVAGHLQHTEGRPTFQVSSLTRNTSVSNFTIPKSIPLHFRREQPLLRDSSVKVAKDAKDISKLLPLTSTISPRLSDFYTEREDNRHDDDEALLDEVDDFDNWDSGILRLSAGSGQESTVKIAKHKEDSKKTLLDQVRDGKYGLIEKELFQKKQKRPGVLSYFSNKEFPNDNESNYGGLNEEDIWLAEDHLLVIKGGSLNDGDKSNKQWPPIDDYDAPERQIKIPNKPKVPPPFPVQLDENGPVQFIGNNKFTVVYPIANESIPVYSTITKANNTASYSSSEHKKNIPAWPGSSENSEDKDPAYIYPAPYPPWLYHNQTFANPFLKNTRPVSFPGLGPFPFSSNGSLQNSNVTDYFDEDEPSLYYPPAYSFVYKSNYTNPVPPGPLVPGIVLPPPVNQFSRLEKPEITSSTTISPPTRYRVQLPPSPPPTPITTSTTSTTTEEPFKQIITKVSEYNPKELNFIPRTEITSTLSSRPGADLPSDLGVTPESFQPIPVPVEVHIPIYPSNNYPTLRPNIVTFVPTTSQPKLSTLSKANPIYYDYFEAKPQSATPNVVEDYFASTVKPPSLVQPAKLYPTSKRPFKSQGHRNYLQGSAVSSHPNQPQENIVYITPKPESRYKAALQMPAPKLRPLESFEEEVNAIRDTLRYYHNQQLRDNNIPRTPKTKSMYQYSVDAKKVPQTRDPDNMAGSFRPPAEYDQQPFKPMVTYSPPVGDENAFRAIAFDKVDSPHRIEQQTQPKYQTTTMLVPVRSESDNTNGRPKNLRLGQNYYQQPLITTYQAKSRPKLQSAYQTTSSTVPLALPSWEALGKHKYASQLHQISQKHHHSARLQAATEVVPTNNRGFGGYYYGQPPHQPIRQNNRFFEAPFQNSIRNILHYKAQQNLAQQQRPVWSLENDTYVNFSANRPPLNPDAEIIDPFPPPALSHQLQYYAPLQRVPSVPPSNHQPIPLHRDVLVNYRQPLPPINPNSEFIPLPHVVRYQAEQFYRTSFSRTTPKQQSVESGYRDRQPRIYEDNPKYRRATNDNGVNANENPNKNNSG